MIKKKRIKKIKKKIVFDRSARRTTYKPKIFKANEIKIKKLQNNPLRKEFIILKIT